MARIQGSNSSKDYGINEVFRLLTGQSEAARSKITPIQIQLWIGLPSRSTLGPRWKSKLQQQRGAFLCVKGTRDCWGVP